MLARTLVPALILYCIGLYILPHVVRFKLNHRLTAANYMGQHIPTAMGSFIWLIVVLSYFLNTILGTYSSSEFGPYVVVLSVITFIGWLDDTIGDRDVKGLRGHWRTWRQQGVFTTGALKLWGTGMMALWMCSHISPTLPLAILHGGLIMLMTNTMNLLDLRPGRMLKVVLIFILLIVLSTTFVDYIPWLLPIIIAVVLVFRKELRGELMLGDTGANLLGFAIGVTLCVATPIWLQVITVILTALLHWLTERHSLTHIIAKHKWLHWFDHLGRAQ